MKTPRDEVAAAMRGYVDVLQELQHRFLAPLSDHQSLRGSTSVSRTTSRLDALARELGLATRRRGAAQPEGGILRVDPLDLLALHQERLSLAALILQDANTVCGEIAALAAADAQVESFLRQALGLESTFGPGQGEVEGQPGDPQASAVIEPADAPIFKAMWNLLALPLAALPLAALHHLQAGAERVGNRRLSEALLAIVSSTPPPAQATARRVALAVDRGEPESVLPAAGVPVPWRGSGDGEEEEEDDDTLDALSGEIVLSPTNSFTDGSPGPAGAEANEGGEGASDLRAERARRFQPGRYRANLGAARSGLIDALESQHSARVRNGRLPPLPPVESASSSQPAPPAAPAATEPAVVSDVEVELVEEEGEEGEEEKSAPVSHGPPAPSVTARRGPRWSNGTSVAFAIDPVEFPSGPAPATTTGAGAPTATVAAAPSPSPPATEARLQEPAQPTSQPRAQAQAPASTAPAPAPQAPAPAPAPAQRSAPPDRYSTLPLGAPMEWKQMASRDSLRRLYVYEEIMGTEKAYVRDLRLLCQLFVQPLRGMLPEASSAPPPLLGPVPRPRSSTVPATAPVADAQGGQAGSSTPEPVARRNSGDGSDTPAETVLEDSSAGGDTAAGTKKRRSRNPLTSFLYRRPSTLPAQGSGPTPGTAPAVSADSTRVAGDGTPPASVTPPPPPPTTGSSKTWGGAPAAAATGAGMLSSPKLHVGELAAAELSGGPILSEEEIRTVFGPVEILLEVHSPLVRSLEQVYEECAWALRHGLPPPHVSARMAQAFCDAVPAFNVYTAYCNNYSKALSALSRLATPGSRFAAFLRASRQNPACRGLDLQSFLIKPVQRICKYPLLFRDLLRHVEETHPHLAELKEAHAAVQRLADQVNERMRESEAAVRVWEVYNALDGTCEDLVQPHRRFVGQAVAVASTQSRVTRLKRKPYIVYVFNDLLLLARTRKTLLGGRQQRPALRLALKHVRDISTIPPRDPATSTGGESWPLSNMLRGLALSSSTSSFSESGSRPPEDVGGSAAHFSTPATSADAVGEGVVGSQSAAGDSGDQEQENGTGSPRGGEREGEGRRSEEPEPGVLYLTYDRSETPLSASRPRTVATPALELIDAATDAAFRKSAPARTTSSLSPVSLEVYKLECKTPGEGAALRQALTTAWRQELVKQHKHLTIRERQVKKQPSMHQQRPVQ